jgi:hypothetical protein
MSERTDLDGTYYSGAAQAPSIARTPDPDNAARERLKEYFGDAEEADHFLAWLWIGGLKVVPLSGDACPT